MPYTIEIVYTQIEEVTFDADNQFDLLETVEAYIDNNKPPRCVDVDWNIIEQPLYYKNLKQDEEVKV